MEHSDLGLDDFGFEFEGENAGERWQRMELLLSSQPSLRRSEASASVFEHFQHSKMKVEQEVAEEWKK